MKRGLLIIVAAAILLSAVGCTAVTPDNDTNLNRYSAQYITLFDTVTTIIGYAENETAFKAVAQEFYDEFEYYHKLYNVYDSFDGINNIKTINDMAGIEPVKVDSPVIELLQFCKNMNEETDGTVDVTMGSVLLLWHDAREQSADDTNSAYIPDAEALQEAVKHTGFDKLVIDEANSTVFLTDPLARLDVGAVAKGYAVERVCEHSPRGFLISVGGNVKATGANPVTNEPWVVGIQDPDGGPNDYVHTIYTENTSVVTSGDYQRYFTVDGVSYNHIIDPATRFPATRWRAVTVLCLDSGIADVLSTALFILPMDKGKQLLELYNAEALWIEASGDVHYSDGFKAFIKR